MARQSLMWTTLPNGLTDDGRSLRVSVLLSPRLETQADPPRLDSFFPDWEDWPGTLARATFEIAYGAVSVPVATTTTSGPNRVDVSLGIADSAVWKALFRPDLPVQSFAYKDLSDHHVLSYPATDLAAAVQALYARLARSANGDMPRVSDLLDDPEWDRLVGAVAALDRRFWDEKTRLRDPARQFAAFKDHGLGEEGSLAATLARFQLFHTPPSTPAPVSRKRTDDPRIEARWLEYQRPPLPAKKDLAPQIDFHQVVAAMNAYPTLLRRLGLVVDFVLDADPFVKAADAPLSTTVTFAAGALTVPRTRDAAPTTHAALTDAAFRAGSNPQLHPEEHRVVAGLLDLDPKTFDILQADVDGAGLKLMGLARTLRRLAAGEQRVDAVTRFEKELGAPALRTAGMMLVHRRRGAALETRFDANKQKNEQLEQVFQNAPGATPPDLWAEDLVRGFRFDVWDATTGMWRSLCQRQARYELDGGAVVVEPAGPEEGTVRLAATRSSDAGSNDDVVYLHEAVVSWTGWSLAAPPPGRAILPDDSVDPSTRRTEAELPPGLRFTSRFRALRGSLPRLRFGRQYWMRARAVDLAGNSLPPRGEDFGPEHAGTHARPFLRYEPLAAPVLALLRPQGGATERPREGESMARIAIRSFNDTPADNVIPTTETARRFAVPPQVSVRDAEHHGRLDAGGKVDGTTFDLLANQKDRDARDPAAALREELIPTQGPLGTAPVDTVFAVYHEGQALTYLPDPLAVEVAARVFGHPGIADTDVITIPLYPGTGWPEAQPFKIEVREDPGAKPTYDAASRTLRVPLPKAVRARVRLSMKLSAEALRILGLWSWLSPADRAPLEPLALDGQHWMLTPWRTVDVVHAVQRPLIAPEVQQLQIQRSLGATSARPRFVAPCSLASTDRVDLLAEWHEPSDDPAAPESETVQIDRSRGDTAFTVKITDPVSYAVRTPGHPLGGIPEHRILGEDLIGIGDVSHDLVSAKHHEFGDTRYRRLQYRLQATTRYREYLPASVLTDPGTGEATDEKITVVGPRQVAWIPSSAPPPAPEVLYVVPTFGWVRTKDAQGNDTRWRRGGGLRVYLDRPWNVSGYGEMLAVVLPPPTFTGNPEDTPRDHPYKKYVTQWGNDPVWLSPVVRGLAPRRADFPLARAAPDPAGGWLPPNASPDEADQPPGPFTVAGLLPPDVPSFPGSTTVEVAPHDVAYDPERRLWYCDIEVDQGASYFPFIRLALARYQPTSVTRAHLSNVVLADFMPLAADRWLNVTRTGDSRKRNVAVFGARYTDSSGHAEASRAPSLSLVDPITHTVRTLQPAELSPTSVVEVWLERLRANRGEDFGWERVPGNLVQPTPAPVPHAPFRFLTAQQLQRSLELRRQQRFDLLVRERLVDGLALFPPLWQGQVTLPAGTPAADRLRLVVAEYEEYLVDDDRPYDTVPERKGRRLVFVEHVEIT